jgi:hypothetical protein
LLSLDAPPGRLSASGPLRGFGHSSLGATASRVRVGGSVGSGCLWSSLMPVERESARPLQTGVRPFGQEYGDCLRSASSRPDRFQGRDLSSCLDACERRLNMPARTACGQRLAFEFAATAGLDGHVTA